MEQSKNKKDSKVRLEKNKIQVNIVENKVNLEKVKKSETKRKKSVKTVLWNFQKFLWQILGMGTHITDVRSMEIGKFKRLKTFHIKRNFRNLCRCFC